MNTKGWLITLVKALLISWVLLFLTTFFHVHFVSEAVLLDEQLPRQLKPHIVGCDVSTVQRERWAGLRMTMARTQSSRYSGSVSTDVRRL